MRRFAFQAILIARGMLGGVAAYFGMYLLNPEWSIYAFALGFYFAYLGRRAFSPLGCPE